MATHAAHKSKDAMSKKEMDKKMKNMPMHKSKSGKKR